jgi:hypothetical protein
LAFTLSLVIGEARAWASPWFLSSCPQQAEQKAAKMESDVRKARPGAPNYVPVPYPKTQEQVFQDFLYQFRDSWSQQSPEDIPAPNRALLSLLETGSVRYQILEVTEWRAQRCSKVFGRKDRLFLIRLFEEPGQKEIGRISLRNSGLIATLDFPQKAGQEMQLIDGHHLETLQQAMGSAQRHGIQGKDFQYVTVASPTLACYESIPCVAFRQGNRAFLYRSGKLFELQHDRVRISNQKFVHKTPERAAAIRDLHPSDHIVSLGGDDLTIASPVN